MEINSIRKMEAWVGKTLPRLSYVSYGRRLGRRFATLRVLEPWPGRHGRLAAVGAPAGGQPVGRTCRAGWPALPPNARGGARGKIGHPARHRCLAGMPTLQVAGALPTDFPSRLRSLGGAHARALPHPPQPHPHFHGSHSGARQCGTHPWPRAPAPDCPGSARCPRGGRRPQLSCWSPRRSSDPVPLPSSTLLLALLRQRTAPKPPPD